MLLTRCFPRDRQHWPRAFKVLINSSKISANKSELERPFIKKNMNTSNLVTQSFLLPEVLIDHRVGIRLARFLPRLKPVDALVLKNSDLRVNDSLVLWAAEGNLCSLENTPTLKRNELKAGDVLAPLTFGHFWAAYVHPSVTDQGKDKIPSFAYGGLMILKPDTRLILPEYLTLWLRSKSAIDQIALLSTESPHNGIRRFTITLGASRQLSISVPPLSVQTKLLQDYSKLIVKKQRIDNQLSAIAAQPEESQIV